MLVFTLVSSCHRDENHHGEYLLSGDWMLVNVTGGIHGQGYTPPFNLLSFSGNSYELSLEGEVISSGTYTYDPAAEHGLVFQPVSSPSPAVGFEDHNKNVLFEGEDVLILSDPCCDLFVYRFEREGDD
jgi:hypothetical protein